MRACQHPEFVFLTSYSIEQFWILNFDSTLTFFRLGCVQPASQHGAQMVLSMVCHKGHNLHSKCLPCSHLPISRAGLDAWARILQADASTRARKPLLPSFRFPWKSAAAPPRSAGTGMEA